MPFEINKTESALYIATASLFALILVYRPTSFLIFLTVGIIYLYLLYEHLFNHDLVDRTAQLPSRLPNRGDFLRKRVRNLMALVYDDCIICRDDPTTPVQVLPCKHIFCKECFEFWLKSEQARCPQCATLLFETTSRVWERLVKANAAHVYVAMPLVLLNLMLGPVNRWRIAIDAIASVLLAGATSLICRRRADYGTEWWKHMLHNGRPVANKDEEFEEIFMNGLNLAVICSWTFYQGLMIESWVGMPKYYLWNVLCAW